MGMDSDLTYLSIFPYLKSKINDLIPLIEKSGPLYLYLLPICQATILGSTPSSAPRLPNSSKNFSSDTLE